MGYQLDFGALAGYFGLFLQGMGVTLGLTAIAASLGLALSKHPSDLLGAKLSLTSELDKGTTVTLALPRNYFRATS